MGVIPRSLTSTKLVDRLKDPPPTVDELPLNLLQQVLPGWLTREGAILDRDIREGRFQRSLSLVAAISSLFSGIEVLSEHYRGSYSQRIMYSPVILSGVLAACGVAGVFSRRAARSVLPLVSVITMLDGLTGFFFHIRGIHRKPGGWRIPVFNVIMGPPVFAPLLFAVSGYLGFIASLLRREDEPAAPVVGKLSEPRLDWLEQLPGPLTGAGRAFERQASEGLLQRHLATAAAISAFFSGIEATYSHYKNNFKYWYQWTPITLTPFLMIAGFGAVFSKRIARTMLPALSLLAMIDGGFGSFFHIRGILRLPGGLRLHGINDISKVLYNYEYGPPPLAPLLFAASGFLGLLASLLRREDR